MVSKESVSSAVDWMLNWWHDLPVLSSKQIATEQTCLPLGPATAELIRQIDVEGNAKHPNA